MSNKALTMYTEVILLLFTLLLVNGTPFTDPVSNTIHFVVNFGIVSSALILMDWLKIYDEDKFSKGVLKALAYPTGYFAIFSLLSWLNF